ncbi:MAG: GrpB family protein [Bacilli bacterium]|nr:GrpB family protein [Bacilli bacterium]
MVKLEPYTNEWKNEFEKEKEGLSTLLNDFKVDIQHVGSTSIEGCCAKPIIDILIGIESLDFSEKLIALFLEHGYIYKFNVPGEIYFKKQCDGLTTHHIHIAPIQGQVWKNQILFRDYLRLHPEKLQEYMELKQDLAIQYPDERDRYSKEKEDFILQILFDAENEVIRKRPKKEI